MARIPLITSVDGLDPTQTATFEWLLESRGEMLRPFEVLLHQPDLARAAGELGSTVRFSTSIPDTDRELVILATGLAHKCAYVWDSHLPLAEAAGVRPEAIAALTGDGELTPDEAELVALVTGLRQSSTAEDALFSSLQERYGTAGVIELTMTVGYYTMLGYTMSACGAC